MTLVKTSVKDLAAAGVQAASASIVYRLALPVFGADGTILTARARRATLDAGVWQREFEPSPVGNAHVFTLDVVGVDSGPYTVVIPDVDEVWLSDLVLNHRVDPDTLVVLPAGSTALELITEAKATADTAQTTAEDAHTVATDAKTTADAALPASDLDAASTALLADPSSQFATLQKDTFVASQAQPTPNAFSGLKGLLASGVSATMGVGSDSTGGGITRWVYLFSQWLAGQYPDYSVAFRPWNQSTLKWDARTVFGLADTRKITFDGITKGGLVEGVSGTSFSNITGDLDLRAKIAPTKWKAGSGSQTIISKFGDAGQRVYRFQLGSDGKLKIDWTTDGNTIQTALASSVVVPFTDGTPGWVRVTFQGNVSGSTVATFYTSTDGYVWTILGTAQTRAGTSTLFSTTTQPCEVGSRSIGQAEFLAGDVYEVEIRDGIDGPIVCPVRPEQWQPGNSFYNAITSGTPVIDIWDGYWSGGGLGGQLIPNQRRMIPAVGMSAWVLSNSHNETGLGSSYMWGLFDAYVNYARSANPAAGILVTAQNPKNAPSSAVAINGQATRCRMLGGFAAQRGYTLIPVYNAFLSSPLGLASLVAPDGIHPSDETGSPLWAQTVASMFDQAM